MLATRSRGGKQNRDRLARTNLSRRCFPQHGGADRVSEQCARIHQSCCNVAERLKKFAVAAPSIHLFYAASLEIGGGRSTGALLVPRDRRGVDQLPGIQNLCLGTLLSISGGCGTKPPQLWRGRYHEGHGPFECLRKAKGAEPCVRQTQCRRLSLTGPLSACPRQCRGRNAMPEASEVGLMSPRSAALSSRRATIWPAGVCGTLRRGRRGEGEARHVRRKEGLGRPIAPKGGWRRCRCERAMDPCGVGVT